MMGRGQETPENHPLIVVRGFFYRLVGGRFRDMEQVGLKILKDLKTARWRTALRTLQNPRLFISE
jgi:hypothetical protein